MVKIIKDNQDFTISLCNEDITEDDLLKMFPSAEIFELKGLEPLKTFDISHYSFDDLPEIKKQISKTSELIKKELLYDKALSLSKDKFSCIKGHEKEYVDILTDEEVNRYGKSMAFLFFREIRGIKNAREALLKIFKLIFE